MFIAPLRENQYKYNKDGFFNVKGYVEKIFGFNWRDLSFSLIMQAPRNMGKSYGIWDFIDKEIWEKSNFKDRIAYFRTNLEKISKIIKFFNSKYKGKYLMTKELIYKVFFDQNGKEIKEQRIEIGAVISIAGEENWRSGEFHNYKVLFWDEFNEEHKTTAIWKHWVNIMKTVERMTDVKVFLVGNKIDGSNDILIKLEIEPVYTEPEDICYFITQEDSPHQIAYLEIGTETFKHLNQEIRAANVWAKFDKETDNFLNGGGFLMKHHQDVLIYRKRILPTRTIKYYAQFGEYKLEYGTFEKGVYFHQIDEFPINANILAMDVLGNMRDKNARAFYSSTDYEDFCEMLSFHSKQRKLFYSSYEIKDILELYIIRFVSLTKN